MFFIKIPYKNDILLNNSSGISLIKNLTAKDPIPTNIEKIWYSKDKDTQLKNYPPN